jgi:hypothetical protein
VARAPCFLLPLPLLLVLGVMVAVGVPTVARPPWDADDDDDDDDADPASPPVANPKPGCSASQVLARPT